MELLQTVIDLKKFTSGDSICVLTPGGPVAGVVENFDAYQRTYTLQSQDGTFSQIEEKHILAVIESAPLNQTPQEVSPTSTPAQKPTIGARNLNFNNYPGGQTNVYDTSTTVNVNVAYGGNANLYFRSSTVSLPPPPTYAQCTNLDQFYAFWAVFYQSNPDFANHTGVPTSTTRPAVAITTSGNVQVTKG